jgi:hypothetical protein
LESESGRTMVQENEIVMLVLGLGVLVFIMQSQRRLRMIPHRRTLLLSYVTLLIAWTSTVLEGFVFPHALNIVEHSCYMISMFIMLLWCYSVTNGDRSSKGAEP